MTPTLQEQLTVTLTHEGGGVIKFSPAIAGKVWCDSYFCGNAVSHATVSNKEASALIIDMMNKGYTVDS